MHRYNALLPSSFASAECVALEGDRLLGSMMADVRAAMASTPLDVVLATRQLKRIVSLRVRRRARGRAAVARGPASPCTHPP